MRPLRRLLVSTSHYSLGSLLSTAAGLASFPFLTRIFSVSDYGMMNLVSATLTALVAVGKLGLQHSVVRFGSRNVAGERSEAPPRQLVSTAVVGMATAGGAVSLAWFAVVSSLSSRWIADDALRAVLQLVSILVFVQIIDSALVNLLRADQRSAALTTYQVLKKYLSLSVMVTALLTYKRELSIFYTAQIASETVAAVLLALFMFRRSGGIAPPAVRDFSAPLANDMLRYGLPMMLGWELAGIVLSLGDRYLVQGLLGPGPLGSYAAAYNLCQYIEMVAIAPWGLAVTPIYLRLWMQGSEQQVKVFLDRSLRYYLLLGAPVIAGLSAIGPELLALMASPKYAGGAPVIPFVVAGLVVNGAVPIVGAGMFIQKRTLAAARYVVLSAVLNLGLNLLLIPALGLLGAGISTLASYSALMVWMSRAGCRYLPVAIDWSLAARATLAALAMFAVVERIEAGDAAATIAARVVAGLLLYCGFAIALDKTAREALVKLRDQARAALS